MIRTVPVGEVRPLGDRAVLVGVEDAGAGRALALALHAGGTTFEVVPGEVTVLVARPHDDAEIGALGAVVEQALGSLDAEDAPGEPGRLVTVPCRFDGPDLLEVCARTGSTPEDVVDLLTRAPLSVAVVGFSPGFAYLHGLPAPLDAVPRRAVPRPVVPAGSVALANGRAAIYPTASPGGWNLVGRTGVPLFFTHRPPYAVLAAGDRVRFTVAGPGDSLEPPAIEPPAWSPTRGSRPVLEVVTPGLRAVVQDGGRRRVVHAGVPQTGPADPDSFDLANRLLHNSPDAGTVELTGGVARLRALAPCHVAVVGAAPDLAVDATPVPPGHVLPLVRDQVLRVGPMRGGCRTYVAVAGGVLGPTVFGSSATDELTGLGAGPLKVGARLWVGEWVPPLGDHLLPGAATEIGGDGGPVDLRVLPGPHRELFVADALDRLSALVFRVQSESNRVGIRLRADTGSSDLLAPRAGHGSIDSHGVVTGTVQVPPGGDPVVLGPDHATLGGYPVLAVVATVDLGRLGQCAPGTTIRLVPLDASGATEAHAAARRARHSAVVGRYPVAVD